MLNGSLKSLCLLWANLANNQRYSRFVQKEDLSTFWRRVSNEGLTFLTVTLPLIGKSLDSFHSTSEWKPPNHFELCDYFNQTQVGLAADDPHLAKYQVFRVPVFLAKAIVAAINGDSEAVDCVRQLTFIFYKLEVPHDAEKVDQFLESFIKTDRGLDSTFDCTDDRKTHQDTIISRMRYLIGRVLCNTDPLDIVPSHGSGATACRTPNSEKYHKFRFFPKLDALYPYSSHFFFSPTHLADELEKLENSEVMETPCARVCLVPKDSRGPRVISCEPAEFMYIQQGIMRKLYEVLETHPLTSGRINFTDQTINRELARIASIDGRNATIDLSDASDRVSLELVRRVFPTSWFEALEACRSEETILPNKQRIKLNKFAPMGSSCCFPVEALVFWACAEAAVHMFTGIRHSGKTYVYGDDIITPSIYYDVVVRGLESVGLLVNQNKSYCRGPFRESCGGDYHNGYDVTPVRVRKFFDKSRTSVATNADLCNSFVAKFGYSDSTRLIQVIEEAGGYVYPRSELRLPAVIRCTPGASNDVFFRKRFNKNLQREEYRILTVHSISRMYHPPNWGEFLRKELCKARISSDSNTRNYEHWASEPDSHSDPGWYTDVRAVVTSWAWTWLG